MKVYSINYDLRAPGRNYAGLYEEIKSYGTYAHPLESTWLIRTSQTAQQICERLRQHLDANDHILILETGPDFYGWLTKEQCDWLDSELGVLN